MASMFFSFSLDYVKIMDEDNATVGEYCGFYIGKNILVAGHYAVIIFHSNSDSQARGFRFVFTAVQPCKWVVIVVGSSPCSEFSGFFPRQKPSLQN